MQELIAQTKPTILIEVVKETYGEVSSMLEKHGYTLTQQAGSLNYFAEIK